MFNQQNLVKLTTLALLFMCFFTANAQKRVHVVYVELGGNALFYSANYDVRFAQSSEGLGLRFGVSTTTDDVFAPLQLNYVIGEKHALEIGAGILAGFDKTYLPNASVMYRYQSAKGLNFRIGWTPIFSPKNKDVNSYITSNALFGWGGVSFGYRF